MIGHLQRHFIVLMRYVRGNGTVSQVPVALGYRSPWVDDDLLVNPHAGVRGRVAATVALTRREVIAGHLKQPERR